MKTEPRLLLPKPFSRLRHSSFSPAFSLVETLFVVAIITMLLAVAATGAKKSWQSQEIKGSALRLAHDISLASMTAVKYNAAVQLRLYKYNDPAIVAEEPQIHAYQIVALGKTGIPAALFEMQRLEGTTLVSSSRRFSSALPTSFTQGSLPLPIGKYEYASIEFRPDGSTGLESTDGKALTLTLIPVRYAERIGELPKEFQTLAISPETGSVRIY